MKRELIQKILNPVLRGLLLSEPPEYTLLETTTSEQIDALNHFVFDHGESYQEGVSEFNSALKGIGIQLPTEDLKRAYEGNIQLKNNIYIVLDQLEQQYEESLRDLFALSQISKKGERESNIADYHCVIAVANERILRLERLIQDLEQRFNFIPEYIKIKSKCEGVKSQFERLKEASEKAKKELTPRFTVKAIEQEIINAEKIITEGKVELIRKKFEETQFNKWQSLLKSLKQSVYSVSSLEELNQLQARITAMHKAPVELHQTISPLETLLSSIETRFEIIGKKDQKLWNRFNRLIKNIALRSGRSAFITFPFERRQYAEALTDLYKKSEEKRKLLSAQPESAAEESEGKGKEPSSSTVRSQHSFLLSRIKNSELREILQHKDNLRPVKLSELERNVQAVNDAIEEPYVSLTDFRKRLWEIGVELEQSELAAVYKGNQRLHRMIWQEKPPIGSMLILASNLNVQTTELLSSMQESINKIEKELKALEHAPEEMASERGSLLIERYNERKSEFKRELSNFRALFEDLNLKKEQRKKSGPSKKEAESFPGDLGLLEMELEQFEEPLSQCQAKLGEFSKNLDSLNEKIESLKKEKEALPVEQQNDTEEEQQEEVEEEAPTFDLAECQKNVKGINGRINNANREIQAKKENLTNYGPFKKFFLFLRYRKDLEDYAKLLKDIEDQLDVTIFKSDLERLEVYESQLNAFIGIHISPESEEAEQLLRNAQQLLRKTNQTRENIAALAASVSEEGDWLLQEAKHPVTKLYHQVRFAPARILQNRLIDKELQKLAELKEGELSPQESHRVKEKLKRESIRLEEAEKEVEIAYTLYGGEEHELPEKDKQRGLVLKIRKDLRELLDRIKERKNKIKEQLEKLNRIKRKSAHQEEEEALLESFIKEEKEQEQEPRPSTSASISPSTSSASFFTPPNTNLSEELEIISALKPLEEKSQKEKPSTPEHEEREAEYTKDGIYKVTEEIKYVKQGFKLTYNPKKLGLKTDLQTDEEHMLAEEMVQHAIKLGIKEPVLSGSKELVSQAYYLLKLQGYNPVLKTGYTTFRKPSKDVEAAKLAALKRKVSSDLLHEPLKSHHVPSLGR